MQWNVAGPAPSSLVQLTQQRQSPLHPFGGMLHAGQGVVHNEVRGVACRAKQIQCGRVRRRVRALDAHDVPVVDSEPRRSDVL